MSRTRTDRRTRRRRSPRRSKRRGRRNYFPFGALRYKIAIGLIAVLVITALILTVLPPPDSTARPAQPTDQSTNEQTR
ncbi:hypothetical protein [Pseudonocardia spinosispora]|uniref:hypothetical protein n=1 Tax=Pseudonocardia spinosispora TaxID=103441 RepID=UPI0003F6603F|nr:hypothetical protein [Pseudonocardia spinosispora]